MALSPCCRRQQPTPQQGRAPILQDEWDHVSMLQAHVISITPPGSATPFHTSALSAHPIGLYNFRHIRNDCRVLSWLRHRYIYHTTILSVPLEGNQRCAHDCTSLALLPEALSQNHGVELSIAYLSDRMADHPFCMIHQWPCSNQPGDILLLARQATANARRARRFGAVGIPRARHWKLRLLPSGQTKRVPAADGIGVLLALPISWAMEPFAFDHRAARDTDAWTTVHNVVDERKGRRFLTKVDDFLSPPRPGLAMFLCRPIRVFHADCRAYADN